MQNWKYIAKKILFPPIWLIMIMVLISTVGLVAIFVNGWEKNPLACVFYVVAFYTLTVVCIVLWKVLPGFYGTVNSKMHANKNMDRYMTDVVFRMNTNLYISLGISLLYVLTNAISGIIYKTYWFGIFAVYYGIIAIMKFLLVRYVGHNLIGDNHLAELKRARLCAGILLTVNLALSAAVLMMIFFDRGFNYQGILIYVNALFTFYMMTIAIIDLIKYRKYKSPIMSITMVIKMASALFSMLFLETAMFAQFGKETSAFVKRLMIMLTGAGISIIVLAMAIYVLVKTTKEIREIGCEGKLFR